MRRFSNNSINQGEDFTSPIKISDRQYQRLIGKEIIASSKGLLFSFNLW
jgi:hypothetical protein